MSVGSNLVWGVIGGGGPADNGERSNIQGEANTVDTITRLQGRSHNGVYDGTSEENEKYGAINRMELAFDQSYITVCPSI